MVQLQKEGYSILFSGDLLAGTRRPDSLKILSKLTNLPEDELLESLFSVKPLIINQTDNSELAKSYVAAFREAGLDVSCEPIAEEHDELLNVEIEFSLYAPKNNLPAEPNFTVDAATNDNTDTELDLVDLEGLPEHAHLLNFEGELTAGSQRADVVSNLVMLSNESEARVIEQIFSVVPVCIFAGIDLAEVQENRIAFEQAGLILTSCTARELPEAIPESRIHIRTDAPPPLPPKTVPQFTYMLLGLTAVTLCVWAIIYTQFSSIFKQPPVLELQVELQMPASFETTPDKTENVEITPIENIPQIIEPTPAPKQVENTQPEPPAAVLKTAEPSLIVAPTIPRKQQPIKPTPPDIVETKQEPKKPAIAESSLPSSAEPETIATDKLMEPADTENVLKIEQSYYLQLLNWFAQPRNQGYDADVRKLNLEGEIEIQITIDREGNVRELEVVKTTSAQLAEIITGTARAASPYPAVPSELTGKEYSFTLPLRYTLKSATN